MDTLSKKERSKRMSLVRCKDTKPEMKVRRLVHRMGHRYRLHKAGLPGKPDLSFARKRKAIFVHGCFWHRHEGCKWARLPKSRQDFWRPKLEGNKQRDIRNQKALRKMGWEFLIIWECETGDLNSLKRRIHSFLSAT